MLLYSEEVCVCACVCAHTGCKGLTECVCVFVPFCTFKGSVLVFFGLNVSLKGHVKRSWEEFGSAH